MKSPRNTNVNLHIFTNASYSKGEVSFLLYTKFIVTETSSSYVRSFRPKPEETFSLGVPNPVLTPSLGDLKVNEISFRRGTGGSISFPVSRVERPFDKVLDYAENHRTVSPSCMHRIFCVRRKPQTHGHKYVHRCTYLYVYGAGKGDNS